MRMFEVVIPFDLATNGTARDLGKGDPLSEAELDVFRDEMLKTGHVKEVDSDDRPAPEPEAVVPAAAPAAPVPVPVLMP